jgi:NhaP-type Na+/H+ or K+/H+ antiporter
MGQAELLIAGLLVAVAGFSALARAMRIPYPIVLVLGGALFGFIPGLPAFRLDPSVVLVVFLPPLVYGAAFFSDLGYIRKNVRTVGLNSVGLVLATMVVVAVTAHGVIDHLSWGAAFALGAIVSPTDPLAGWVIARVRARTEDAQISITISLLSGYAAFIPADLVGASGVLAAVTTGIYVGIKGPSVIPARIRLQGTFVWEMLAYIINASLFVLVGLQLRGVVDQLHGNSALRLAGYAAAVSVVVIVVRIAWFLTIPLLIRMLDRRASQLARRVGWQVRVVVAWAGMRGSVSLAAALALPLRTHAHQPFPERSLIVFLTFAVIFATLVVQGLTLPSLVRRLGVTRGESEDHEELRARLMATKAALAQLDDLAGEEWTREDTIDRMRRIYEYRKRRFAARAGKIEDDGYEDRSLAYQQVVQIVLAAQRETLVRLRNSGEISNETMNAVIQELDLEESRLEI